MTVLALDRINKIGKSVREFYAHPDFDSETYHNDIIGVTLPSDRQKVRVESKAYGKARNYLNTKPLHHSQQLVKMGKKAARFTLEVIPNPELETKLLSYCEHIEVIEPKELREKIASRVSASTELYVDKKPKKKKKKKGKKKK